MLAMFGAEIRNATIELNMKEQLEQKEANYNTKLDSRNIRKQETQEDNKMIEKEK